MYILPNKYIEPNINMVKSWKSNTNTYKANLLQTEWVQLSTCVYIITTNSIYKSHVKYKYYI